MPEGEAGVGPMLATAVALAAPAVPQWLTMLHRRYYIESLRTSGLPVPAVGGDLVVASQEQTDDIDWELIYRSSEQWHLRPEPYDLEMEGPEGRLAGPAILVRSDGRSHVFRGVGTLEGFDPATFNRS